MNFLESIQNLRVWTSGDVRAPHKPLLLLLMLGRYLGGGSQLVSFSEVESPLRELLKEFGPPRKAFHPELPFWHLRSDGIWAFDSDLPFRSVGKSASAKKSTLLQSGVRAGFTDEAFEAIQDRATAAAAIRQILDSSFPESIHDDLLDAVGITGDILVGKRRRDPAFREAVLRAYQYSCAVCGFKSQLGSQIVGVEAAHIKWHQAGGPDTQPNGVALCALHHRLLDRGMITISPTGLVVLSEHAHGSGMFQHMVADFHGRPIAVPVRSDYAPSSEFLGWHVREVFRSPGREVA